MAVALGAILFHKKKENQKKQIAGAGACSLASANFKRGKKDEENKNRRSWIRQPRTGIRGLFVGGTQRSGGGGGH